MHEAAEWLSNRAERASEVSMIWCGVDACSVLKLGVDVRSVDGGVATSRPTAALLHKGGVVDLADEKIAWRGLHLGMAFQAEIGVVLDQELGVHGAVRIVANRAALAHGFVLKDKLAGLIAMALGARLIHLGQPQAACRFHHVVAVRIMALDAIQMPLKHRVMIWQAELGVNIFMATEAGFGSLLGVDDEFVSALPPCGDVAAGRAVAGFTTGIERFIGHAEFYAGVGIGGEFLADVGVAIGTRLVPDEFCAFDVERFLGRARDCAARGPQEQAAGEQHHSGDVQPAL